MWRVLAVSLYLFAIKITAMLSSIIFAGLFYVMIISCKTTRRYFAVLAADAAAINLTSMLKVTAVGCNFVL